MFVKIEKQPLPADLSYALFTYPGGFEFSHVPFEVVTYPINTSLCGNVKYTTRYEQSLIDNNSAPMSYDE